MSTGPSAKDLKVKASFFLNIEPSNDNLTGIQRHLKTSLERQGYRQYSANLRPYGPILGTIEFVNSVHMVDSKLPLITRIKSLLGGDVSDEIADANAKESLRRLRDLRDDIVYQYVFYFIPTSYKESEGFDVRVEATPVLLQKFRQINLEDDYTYNIEDVVQETKDQVNKVVGNLGVTPYSGPYTEAESIDPLISNKEQESLQQFQYGRIVLDYINQGDRCLENGFLHAALNCYIHGIEWAIICYKEGVEDIDLIKKQREEDNYLTFSDIVDEIKTGTPVNRLTHESLANLNAAERRWIAHHRKGAIPRTNVEGARENLGRLIGELFREKVEEKQS